MHDQANELRQLVRQSIAPLVAPPTNSPFVVAVTGGKGGVGTTTIAVNLAAALADEGRRVVLLDLDFGGADARALCQLDVDHTVVDVLEGRRTIHEVLARGPAGMLVLPGPCSLDTLVECTASAQDRLLADVRQFGGHADVVIVDVGSGRTRRVERFCRAADAVLVVTTPEPVAVLDAYAMLKILHTGNFAGGLYPLVNRAADQAVADHIHARLAQACHRFLGYQLAEGGFLPDDLQVARAGHQGQPFVLQYPHCPAAQQLKHILAWLVRAAGAGSTEDHQVIHQRLELGTRPAMPDTPTDRQTLALEV